VPGYVSFIDLGGLKQRSHNGGDYKLGIVASVSFWSRESILARFRAPFIDNLEGTAIYPSLHHECGVLTHMTGPHIC
jgi:hypothetical protein